MIFAVVGTQFPFDRMIRCVDKWAMKAGIKNIVAQTGRSSYQAKSIETYEYIEPAHFDDLQRRAQLLIAHAGMGTIIGALELRKPLIIMPRLSLYGEHRNDHQLSTAEKFKATAGIYVAMDDNELVRLLERRSELKGATRGISPFASIELVSALRTFIASSEDSVSSMSAGAE